MPSLRIPFPEGTRNIALRGDKITIGRLPDNVIQIRDRAISAYHAELVWEEDHYRMHDRSSTNGVLVGGQVVADYHLRDNCQIILGGLECEYTIASTQEATDMETLATRGEMQTVLQANSNLQQQVASLQAQVEAMILAREASASADEPSVPLSQHDKLAADAAALRASLHERQTQIERLSTLLAIAHRERDTLQKAYDDAREALAKATGATPDPKKRFIPGEGGPSAPAVPAKITAPASGIRPAPPTAGSPTSGVRPAPAAPAPPSAPAVPPPAAPMPKPPTALGNGSPIRRPASAATPAQPAAAVAASNGKSTEKLTE